MSFEDDHSDDFGLTIEFNLDSSVVNVCSMDGEGESVYVHGRGLTRFRVLHLTLATGDSRE